MLTEWTIKKYLKGATLREIAREQGINPTTVMRFLIRNGIPIRNKSESQKLLLRTGRVKHPTKGKKRDEETKVLIGQSVSKSWENLSTDEKERRGQIAKDNWENMSDEHKELLKKKGIEAVKRASREGSKLEHFIYIGLRNLGYSVQFHANFLCMNEKMQADLFLPDLRTIVEIDGPSHFESIWGEDVLEKTKRADKEKNGLLVSGGYCVIRLKNLFKHISETKKRKFLSALLIELKKLETAFPPLENRIILVELNA